VWALDRGNVVTRAYDIRALDTTIVIADGREVARTFHPQSVEQLRAALAKAEQREGPQG
jgi:thioredoxin-like negative regulator of GroEL